MANQTKLKKILDSISKPDVRDAFKSVEKEMQRVADKLKTDSEIKTAEVAKYRINEIRQQIQSISDYLNTLKEDLKKSDGELSNALNQKIFALKDVMEKYRSAAVDKLSGLSTEMDGLKSDIRTLSNKKIEIPDFAKQIKDVEDQIKGALVNLTDDNEKKVGEFLKESQKSVAGLSDELKKLRIDTMSMIGRGGGNANRNILVSGNPSTLGRYTDLNIKPGTNVTITYLNNDTLKTTDLTIAASGGAGTSRNISTVAVSSVVAATASTDIVIIASAGIKLTMPTAVGNTNLYTIKNTSTSSVLLAPNGVETIDAAANLILNVQYTSVDLISDSANWQIT